MQNAAHLVKIYSQKQHRVLGLRSRVKERNSRLFDQFNFSVQTIMQHQKLITLSKAVIYLSNTSIKAQIVSLHQFISFTLDMRI